MMDVLDGFEPRHAAVVNMMSLVVEHGEFFDLADDFAKVGLAVRRFTGRLCAEGGEEIVAQVLVLQRRVADLAKKNAVDVREENISDVADDPDVVLNVQG